MEIFREKFEKKNKWHWARNIVLALWLALGVSNFSYSQENWWRHFDKTEQTNESWKKSIEAYKIRVVNRNNNIVNNTSETLDEFVLRLQKQFEFETKKNSNIQDKISDIKNILNNQYSQNITSDNPFIVLQTAIKVIANMGKYWGLSEYSNRFSNSFDINFIDALWYIQYVNDFSCNWTLSWKNWELTLNKIIEDLNFEWGNQSNGSAISNTWKNDFKWNQIEKQKEDQSSKKQESNKSSIDTKVNKVSSDYSAKIENRNKNITNNTSETLDEFAKRISKQFEHEINDKNSLISKKIWNIKELLSSQYNIWIGDNPVLIVESALTELSKTEKYNWLQWYTKKFSGKFDLNFVDAYWFVQYINDWNCNWSLCGKNWAFILQSIYDDLSNIEKNNWYNTEDNGLNHDNTIQPGNNTVQHDNTVQPNNDVDNGVANPTKDDVPDIEPDYIEIEWISLLSKNLSSDKLNWVTYEDVWNTVDWFKHEWLRNAVMNCLLHNDVIWAQRLLWMDINCNRNRYPNYVASTKLWQRELDLMEKLWESRRYMDTQEILNFMERVEKAYEIENYEVKSVYLKFLSWELSNDWLPYCIVSKYDYKIYLFSADHKLLACQPVLTWAHIWNSKNNPMNGSHTTPGGMYVMWWAFDKSSEWKNLVSVYWTDYLVLLPKENQYNYWEEYSMWIHGYVKGREWRLSSQNTIDHRVSNWCINMDRSTFWEIINHLKTWSKVYVCKDDEM